jgi:hypothetical protein
MSFEVIGHIGNDIRMVRRQSGKVAAEQWDEGEGKWVLLEDIANASMTRTAQAGAINAFRRRQLAKLA